MDELIHSKDGLNLKLSDDEQKIEVYSNLFIDAYRYTKKSYQVKICKKLSAKYGDDFYANWSFFKIVNSNYAKSLSLTSCGLSDDRKFNHFCMVGNDEMIDVLTTYDPGIKVLL